MVDVKTWMVENLWRRGLKQGLEEEEEKKKENTGLPGRVEAEARLRPLLKAGTGLLMDSGPRWSPSRTKTPRAPSGGGRAPNPLTPLVNPEP